MSFSAIINIMIDNSIEVSSLNSFDQNFSTSNEYFYKKLHMVIYLSVFTISGNTLGKEEWLSVFNNFFQNQVSMIQSQKQAFNKKDLNFYSCGQYSNVLLFCVDYEITNLNDFLFISFMKNPLLNDNDKEEFSDRYMVKIHTDYYFMDSCNEKWYFDQKVLEDDVKLKNIPFFNNKIFYYIRNIFGSFSIRINEKFIKDGGRNIIMNLKIMKLILDSGVVFENNYFFNSFIYENQTIEYSPNIFTLTFRLSPLIQIFQFKYKKILDSFAEIAGIMGLAKFLFLMFALIINFFNKYSSFSGNAFKRKIIFINSAHINRNKFSVGEKKLAEEIKNMSNNRNKKIDKENSDNKTVERLSNMIKTNNYMNNNTGIDRNLITNNQQNVSFYVDAYKKHEGQIIGVYNIKNNFELEPAIANQSLRNIVHNNFDNKNNNNSALSQKKLSSPSPFRELYDIDQNKVENYLKEKNAITKTKFSVYLIFCIFICGKCVKSKKVQRRLLFEMVTENNRNMNIFKIMKTPKKFDILTFLLLNKKQRSVMKLIEKEQIVYDKADDKASFYKKYKNSHNKTKRAKLIYEFLKGIHDNQASELDKKLFFLLDEDFNNNNT